MKGNRRNLRTHAVGKGDRRPYFVAISVVDLQYSAFQVPTNFVFIDRLENPMTQRYLGL
jgi:hypothetical protein